LTQDPAGIGNGGTVSGMKQEGQTKRRIQAVYAFISDTYLSYTVSEKPNPAQGGVWGSDASIKARFSNI